MRIMRLESWRVALGLCAAWLVGSGCTDSGVRRDTVSAPDSVVPTPPSAQGPQPGACPKDRPPRTAAELKLCAGTLQFDTDTLAADEQPLTIIGTTTGLPCPGGPKLRCRYGPMARIEPFVGAEDYTEEELRQGRIIARISVPRGEKMGYKKYGLLPGRVTYWWVKTDTTRTGGESVFLTETADGKVVPVRRKLNRYIYERGQEPARALARWIWTLKDETAKARCGTGSCS
jgi:hypothetical protein